jgi:hypothetical protein
MAIIDVSDEVVEIATTIQRIQMQSQMIRPQIDLLLNDLGKLFNADGSMKKEALAFLDTDDKVKKTTGIYQGITQLLKTIDG